MLMLVSTHRREIAQVERERDEARAFGESRHAAAQRQQAMTLVRQQQNDALQAQLDRAYETIARVEAENMDLRLRVPVKGQGGRFIKREVAACAPR